jgi:hypothetical protein
MNAHDELEWVAIPFRTWQSVASRLPKPWHPEVAEADLVFWEHFGGRPGRQALATRWGWTEHKARALIDSFGGAP